MKTKGDDRWLKSTGVFLPEGMRNRFKDHLLKEADTLMYEVKAAGKSFQNLHYRSKPFNNSENGESFPALRQWARIRLGLRYFRNYSRSGIRRFKRRIQIWKTGLKP